MGWIAGIFVYFLIWWVVLFAVLPWGVQVPDNPEPGHAPSAPINPHTGPEGHRDHRRLGRHLGRRLVRHPAAGSLCVPCERVTMSAADEPRRSPTAMSRPATPGTAPITTASTASRSRDDAALFERLVLEINQAGLSLAHDPEEARGLPAGLSRASISSASPRYGAARSRAPAGRCRHHPQPAEGRRGHRERPSASRRSARVARLLRRLARRPSPARQGGVGQALQEDLLLHRRRDRRRVPDEHRLPARAPTCRAARSIDGSCA